MGSTQLSMLDLRRNSHDVLISRLDDPIGIEASWDSSVCPARSKAGKLQPPVRKERRRRVALATASQ
eukprot:3033974-Prymnesium_polylepis.1